MMSRALPLLLLFITFLFINAEVWQVTSRLDGGDLWLTVLLFSALAVAFLLVRLPEEVDRTDDDVDDAFLLDACRARPSRRRCRELVDDPESDPASFAEVTGFERGNLVMVLVIIQVVQVLLLAVTVFVFFLVFGGADHDRGRDRVVDRGESRTRGATCPTCPSSWCRCRSSWPRSPGST